MEVKDQVRIMKAQMSNFKSLMDKMQYMSEFFDPDPQFTLEARDIVRADLCRRMKQRDAKYKA